MPRCAPRIRRRPSGRFRVPERRRSRPRRPCRRRDVPQNEGEVAAVVAARAARAAGRRAVVAHRRRDAARRRRPQHAGADGRSALRPADRVRVGAGVPLAAAAANARRRRPVLPAGPDLRWGVRRRHHRHERGRRGHVQVRLDTRLGRRDHRRPRQRRRARDPRGETVADDRWPLQLALSGRRRNRNPDPDLRDARRAEAVRRLVRAPRNGSHRSVHRVRRHARRHRRCDAARHCAAASMPRARSLRRRWAGGRGHARAARGGARRVDGRRARSMSRRSRYMDARALRTVPDDAFARAAVSTAAGRLRHAAAADRSRRGRRRRAGTARRGARRARRGGRSPRRGSRRRPRRRSGCSSCARLCPPA